MLLYPGRWRVSRDSKKAGRFLISWATVSANQPSYVKMWLKGELIEHIWVSPYSPHTWWASGNTVLSEESDPDSVLVIEVGDGAILRLEGHLTMQKEV